MKLSRRSFLKTGGTIIASLFTGGKTRPVKASVLPRILPGRQVPGRCPLCSMGCGLIYQSRGAVGWFVEGDPDCPIARGSLCSRGAGLAELSNTREAPVPMYRAPGGNSFTEISWGKAVQLVARRLKDLRDRDLGLFSADAGKIVNRFDSLGVITGGCLTNEEAYLTSKLFRALGVVGMDTTARASHGSAISGVLHTLGLPGGTHPVTQAAYSDVVVLVGCNPGQTAPALCRYLDEVRRRRGTVIVIDPRRSETIRKDDIWLQIRPGTDNAVLGAFMNWVLQYADIPRVDLIENSDAAFITVSEIMGEYERHRSGKYKNWTVVDDTLSEPNSIFQRMVGHFKRYDLQKVAGITGVDIHLLRRACTLLARTSGGDFSASFIMGSGALASPVGTDSVRMAAGTQALLGNLDKMGGGVILPTAAGNAQGVCDMGLLAPYLPGYIDLPRFKKGKMAPIKGEALGALVRAWYPHTSVQDARTYLPHLDDDESPSISTIIQGIGDEQVRAVLSIGADPLSSLPDNSSIEKALTNLDLLVVMDSMTNRMSSFWKKTSGREKSIKTEVIFIPTEPPPLKNGSMTDSGRRARYVRSAKRPDGKTPGLLQFMVNLGNSLRSKYVAEGGVLARSVLDLQWPLTQVPEEVAAEINGFRKAADLNVLLQGGNSWQKEDRCGNHLYRGWVDDSGWLVHRRDAADPFHIGLFDRWGWFWPWSVADPFSWINKHDRNSSAYLRWLEQGNKKRSAEDVLPIRPRLPVKFWKLVDKGNPFPEHHEPFHSPLPDYLTGGRASPNMQLRREGKDKWGYLSRRPEDFVPDYPVIISLHRTGNIMGTGGITAQPNRARELGVNRIVEVGPELASLLGARNGDKLAILSPYSSEGITATALVTRRVRSFKRDNSLHHVVSLTLYGHDDVGVNVLTPPAFDYLTGGMELKVFMGRIKKADS